MQHSISRLMSAKALTFSTALLAMAAPAFAVGCSSASTGTGSGSGSVGGTAVEFNRSTHALTAGTLLTVDGTYGAGCSSHTITDKWSVSFEPLTPPFTPNALPFAPLLVNSSDLAGCQLTITELDATAGVYTTATPITLLTGFEPAASLFTTGIGPGSDEFYANAQINPADFSTPVTINVETSDNANDVTPVTITATISIATQTTIPAPDYAAVSDVSFASDFTTGLVTAQSGDVTLTLPLPPGPPAPQAGESYLIATGLGGVPILPPPPVGPGIPAPIVPPESGSFAADDFAFNNAGTGPYSAIVLIPAPFLTFTVDSTALIPTGTPVPSTSIIIIQHVDLATSVKTYETVEYDFAGGPR
jgi:hypothetical protein